MPPTSASRSMPTTCHCRATTRRLAQDSNPNEPDNSISESTSFSGQHSSSPSAALLQARSLTTHWTHLSTTCPNSSTHLTSPSILRDLITALERITKKYEIHLWKMVFAKTTGPGTDTNPNLVPTLYPGLVADGASGAMTGHIGVYRLEEDETQILVQEALRTSIEELGGVLSEIQRRVGLLRENEESMAMGMFAGGGWNHMGQLLGSLGQIPGDGSGLYDHRDSGTSLDGEAKLSMDEDVEREMNGGNESNQEERMQVRLPTDEEMGEINVRLYGCLRRLDFLESGEVGK